METAFRRFGGLAISLIILTRLQASQFDINEISEQKLATLLQTNGVSPVLASRIVNLRSQQGWIWEHEDLLLAGVPDAMLGWFRYRFVITMPQVPEEEFSPDLADFLIYPIDLNSASPSALRMLPNMTEHRLKRLLDFRTHQHLSSLREMLTLGWTVEDIRRISPYVRLRQGTNQFWWRQGLRMESDSLLYTSFVTLPWFRATLLIPRAHTLTGNYHTLLTQAVWGGVLITDNASLYLGDFRYRQGLGLLFGSPFGIISRDADSLIDWEKGYSSPRSPTRDQNENRFDETIRGIGGQASFAFLNGGVLFASNQMTLAGGFMTAEWENLLVGGQYFHGQTTNRSVAMLSGFARGSFYGLEAGGEYAVSEAVAFMAYLRYRRENIVIAGAVYDGATNYFDPFAGELYRGVRGKQGIVAAAEWERERFRLALRAEWYTNKRTTYTTTKIGATPTYRLAIHVPWIGLNSISLPLAYDNRTNQIFTSAEIRLEGWLIHPSFSWVSINALAHHNNRWGYESQTRLRLTVGGWSAYVWYCHLVPLRSNPISITFPPLEAGEMESAWFRRTTDVFAIGIRYRRREFSASARLLQWSRQTRFAMSVGWLW